MLRMQAMVRSVLLLVLPKAADSSSHVIEFPDFVAIVIEVKFVYLFWVSDG